MTTQTTMEMALIGSGGDGVMTTAALLLRVAARCGLYGMMTQSYGPQIRGGESAAHVTIGVAPVATVSVVKDLIVCFRFADAARFPAEIRSAAHAALFHGADGGDVPEGLRAARGLVVPIPFVEILAAAGLPELAKNIFLLGVLCRALGWNPACATAALRELFGAKSAAVLDANDRALILGYRHLERIALPFPTPTARAARDRIVISGNEACARAAVDAGCRFYAGYPITPSSEILETMDELLPEVGGHLIQAEDEIAALGMVIGASYGGIPAMTATSGPGLSLMTEMLGLAAMAEVPVVVVDCQRGGPSTGMPSRTEQGDLWHALYGGHGDFPRVVLAATDVTDCYRTLFRAFYCAEAFQLPVIVLSDAAIAQRSEIIDPVENAAFPRGERLRADPLPDGGPAECREGGYRRFDLRAGADPEWPGVNAVAIPGTPGGMHNIAGIEHTERGTPSADGVQHEAMQRKRFRKLEAIAQQTAGWYTAHGVVEAPHALIAWGSSVGVARQYAAARKDSALFVPEILHPFPLDGLRRFLKGRRTITVLEMNFQGQLYHHLRACGGIGPEAVSARRSGGLPFQLEELERMIGAGGGQ